MQFPEDVKALTGRLEKAGYSAYAVGGCVRDTMMGRTPNDWDVCTSAMPEEMKRVFAGEHVVETGLKHGTLTVVMHHVPYEITTFREDGEYTDHRHPDSVTFVRSLPGDLARRDFTINAMACAAGGEVIDLFGGMEDLKNRIIRCVGEPEKRFEEDALRILRALRFASALDFAVEEKTARAAHEMGPTIGMVARERIREELFRLLCGKGAGRILREYPDVITFLIPELKEAVDFDQNNPHHLFTVWEHTVRTVENVPADPVLRMTMLLHDSGKPFVQTTDENGISHYRGHQAVSAEIAGRTLEGLRCDRATAERIVRLVEAHDIPLSTERKIMLRRLNRFGAEDLRALFLIHCADRTATGTRNPEHAREHCLELQRALDELLAENPCFTLRDLKVNGKDLKELGLRGPRVGETLNALLAAVMDGEAGNTREELLPLAEKMKANRG